MNAFLGFAFGTYSSLGRRLSHAKVALLASKSLQTRTETTLTVLNLFATVQTLLLGRHKLYKK